jgi:PAS domain S-box-containing protein
VVGKQTIFEYTTPETHEVIRDAVAQVFQRGRPVYYETFVPVTDAWFGTVVGPIERNGKVVSASLLSRKITAQKKAEIALRESEERFRQLTEHIEDVFFLYDPIAQETLYVSPAYQTLWGRPLQHVYTHGHAWLEGVHPDDRSMVWERYEELRATCMDPKTGTYNFATPNEYRILRPDGTVRWIRTRNFAIFDDAGNVSRVAGIATDITQRREAAHRLANAEAKYRGLVEKLPVISYIAELGDVRKTLYISPQIEAKLGFSQEHWMADPDLWQKAIHPSDRPRVMAEMRQFRRCGERLHSVYRLLSHHGKIIWFRDEAVLVQSESGGCNIVEGVMLDVSDAEEARVEQQRARALSAHLVEVQENERRHIARELHDEIGQTLTGLKLMLEMSPDKAGVSGRLREARALVGELMEKVRDLSLELRPSMLDDLGLLPTLMSMFERFENQTRVHVKFEHCAMGRRFDPDVETAAYRLAQEGLTNAARYADVNEVEVRAWSDAEHLCVQVHDAGRGFDVAAALADSRKNGLVGMRERVAALGGQLTMESKPGAGTRLTVQIPIPPRDATADADGGER